MKQNPRNPIFPQDKKNESPEEIFQEQKICQSQGNKNPKLLLVPFQERIGFEEIVMQSAKDSRCPKAKEDSMKLRPNLKNESSGNFKLKKDKNKA
jgi:predicted Zn-ribbon and HTH transcriptional regulator